MWAARLVALILGVADANGDGDALRFAYDSVKHAFDVGCARGLFGAAGLTAACFELNDPWLSLMNGEADVVVADSTRFVQMAAARDDLLAVYVAHGTGRSEALMVREEIVSPFEMEGKTFGTVRGSTTHFHLEFANTFFPKFDIQPVDTLRPLLNRFRGGRIDGIFCRGSFCDVLRDDYGAHELLSAKLFDNYKRPTFTVLVTTRVFAAARGDDLGTFLGVLSRIDEDYVTNGPSSFGTAYWFRSSRVGGNAPDGTVSFLASVVDAHAYLGPGTDTFEDPSDTASLANALEALERVEIYDAETQLGCAMLAHAPNCTGDGVFAFSLRLQTDFALSKKLLAFDPEIDYGAVLDGSYLASAAAAAVPTLDALLARADATGVVGPPRAEPVQDFRDPSTGRSTCALSSGNAFETSRNVFENAPVNVTAIVGGAGSIGDGSPPHAVYTRKWACEWLLSAEDADAIVELRFDGFDVWHGDAVYVRARSRDGPLLAAATGLGTAWPPLRARGAVFVVWTTNAYTLVKGKAADKLVTAPMSYYSAAAFGDGWNASYDTDAGDVDCANGGVLFDGLCACAAGWGGGDCSRPACLGRAFLGGDAGAFASAPGAPAAGTYANYALCEFEIAAPPGSVLALGLVHDLQDTFDFLTVETGGERVGRFTGVGDVTLGVPVGDDGAVLVTLDADGAGVAGGFSAAYSVVDSYCDFDETCSGHGHCQGAARHCDCDTGWSTASCGVPRCSPLAAAAVGRSGYFSSQPRGMAIPPDLSCDYVMASEDNRALRIVMHTFDLEPGYGDALEITRSAGEALTLAALTCAYEEECDVPGQTGQCVDGVCQRAGTVAELARPANETLTFSLTTDRNDDGGAPTGGDDFYAGVEFAAFFIDACPVAGGRCEDVGGSCRGRWCFQGLGGDRFYGADGAWDCSCALECKPGEYLAAATKTCSKCPAGTEQPIAYTTDGPNSCRLCADGFYAENAGTGSCAACGSSATTSGVLGATSPKACNCDKGAYSRTWPVGDCSSCGDMFATCPGGLAQPYPDQYYWTAAPLTAEKAEVLRCRFTFVCLGGSASASCAGNYDLTDGGGECRDARGAPLALEDPRKWCDYGKDVMEPMCEDIATSANGESFFAFSTTTYRCPSSETWRTVSTVGSWFCLFILFIVINDVVRPRFSVLDVVLDSFQDLGVISGYWLYWPSSVDVLFSIYNIALFDVDMYTPSCSFPVWGFTHTFYLMMSMPFAYAAFAASRTVVATDRAADDWREMAGSCVSFLFGSMPALLSYTLGTFACRDIVGYGSMLVDAPEESCDTVQVDNMRIVSVVYLAVLIFGMPLAVLALMVRWRRRDELCEPEALAYLGFLYKDYRPDALYWSFVRMCKQAALVIISVVLWEWPYTQAICGIFVLMAVCVLQSKATPFLAPELNMFELLGLCMSILVLALGMLTTSEGTIARKVETTWWVRLFYLSQLCYVSLAVYYASREVKDVASQNFAEIAIKAAIKKMEDKGGRQSLRRSFTFSNLLTTPRPGGKMGAEASPRGTFDAWRRAAADHRRTKLGQHAVDVTSDDGTVDSAADGGVLGPSAADVDGDGDAGSRVAKASWGFIVASIKTMEESARATLVAADGAKHAIAEDARKLLQDLAAPRAGMELIQTFQGSTLRSFVRSSEFLCPVGGGALLKKWVALDAMMAPFVADTSKSNNYSNSHEAAFYRNIIDAVPVLLDVLVEGNSGDRKTIGHALHLLSEETRKRDQWGCGNVVLDTVERIDRSSVLYFFVKASEDDANALSEMIKTFLRVHPPSARKHEAYVRHRAANNIQSMVRRCGFRGLVKSALEAKRQANVSLEILSVGPTDARDDDDDDDKNKAFSFGSGLTKVAPTQPAPICHGSVICGGPCTVPWDTLEAPPDVDLSNVEWAVVPPG